MYRLVSPIFLHFIKFPEQKVPAYQSQVIYIAYVNAVLRKVVWMQNPPSIFLLFLDWSWILFLFYFLCHHHKRQLKEEKRVTGIPIY